MTWTLDFGIGLGLGLWQLRFIYSVTYRLGLFNTTSATNVNLVHGHDADDPLLDHVDEDALVTGHSVHVLVDPVSGSSI